MARHAQDPRAGQLRLGAFPTIAPYLFPHVVPTLRDRLPDLELLLTEEKSAVLIEQLRTGRLDAAVLALPVDDDTLHTELLFREDFVLAVPANHPLAVGASDGSEQAPISIDVLHAERVLLLTEGHCLRDQALAVCQLAGVGERDGFRATSLETLRNMVAAGAGVTLLPMLAVRPPVAESSAIALRAFRDPAPHRDIALVWRRTSVFRDMLPEIAQLLRTVPGDVVQPL
ncbi:MAG TPA: LysR substrate-binding domain-containing protein [Kofleriaceae bacterium]|nr:LysR substrate-binding domain-containing protein [Kofleriaceae bacterium]